MSVCWLKWLWCCYQATAEPPCKSLNRQAWLKMWTILPLSCYVNIPSPLWFCVFSLYIRIKATVAWKARYTSRLFIMKQNISSPEKSNIFHSPIGSVACFVTFMENFGNCKEKKMRSLERILCHQNSDEKCDDVKKKNSMMPTGKDDAASSQHENLTWGSTEENLTWGSTGQPTAGERAPLPGRPLDKAPAVKHLFNSCFFRHASTEAIIGWSWKNRQLIKLKGKRRRKLERGSHL